ncbi:MAG: TetR/AcrR family transcriptional regulator [Deltaproteobacteria bacterium]|nr:TetR/AcrR family transcriptional regulator [Deltaproteobacteria bacterium]
MGRKAYFNSEEFIDSAIKIIAEEGLGALTIAGLATRVTAPVGSVYHRFPSRDALVAELWLNIIESFQGEWLKILQTDGIKAMSFCMEWVRNHPNEARVMLLYRIDDLTSGEWPEDLKKRAQKLSGELQEGIAAFTKKQFGRVTKENIDRTFYAIHDAPMGILRRYMQDKQIPPRYVADFILETYNAVMKKAK